MAEDVDAGRFDCPKSHCRPPASSPPITLPDAFLMKTPVGWTNWPFGFRRAV